MPNLTKTAILEAFRCLTLPYRIVSRKRHASRNQMPVVILYYHRVADTDPVAWSLTNDQFRRHIDWLQRHFEMISLQEAQRRVAEGTSRPSVHVTFDDGYAENCDHALPLLVERQIPCTYFVTLDNVAGGTGLEGGVDPQTGNPPGGGDTGTGEKTVRSDDDQSKNIDS